MVSFSDRVDKWWGEIVIAIGRGKGHETLFIALDSETRDEYKRGYQKGYEEAMKTKQNN